MPNMRAAGQVLITVPVNRRFLDIVDAALPKIGYGDRSSFIRDSMVEKFAREGIKIPLDLSAASPRIGKGGNRKNCSSNVTDAAIAKAETGGNAHNVLDAAISRLGLSPKVVSPTGKAAAPVPRAGRAKGAPPSPPTPVPTKPV